MKENHLAHLRTAGNHRMIRIARRLNVAIVILIVNSVVQGDELERLWNATVQPQAPESRNPAETPEDYWFSGLPMPSLYDHLVFGMRENGADMSAINLSVAKTIEKWGSDPFGDFRTILVCGELMSPCIRNIRNIEEGIRNPADDFENDIELAKSLKQSRHLAMMRSLIAEIQVRDWLKHPEKVERMVWLSGWTGFLSNGNEVFSNVRHLVDDFGGSDIPVAAGSAYCEDARMFMFVACLTSRSDSYRDCEPESLQERFRDWSKTQFSNGRWKFYRASQLSPCFIIDISKSAKPQPNNGRISLIVVPQQPFPDWGELPEPISRVAFFQLSRFPR